MQGTAIGRKLVARYYCATRRADHSCDQPLVHANIVEAQLVEFVADFKPNPAVHEEILRRLAGTATADTTDAAQRRAQLEERLRRARDLYELGDLTRPEYMARREAINTELATSAPGPIPDLDLDQAQQVLEDFSIFWQNESDPAAKRQLLTLNFERIWLDGQHVAAVQPKPSFALFFENQPLETAGKEMCPERERRGSSTRLLPRRGESRFGSSGCWLSGCLAAVVLEIMDLLRFAGVAKSNRGALPSGRSAMGDELVAIPAAGVGF
jgi:hypothetical protein